MELKLQEVLEAVVTVRNLYNSGIKLPAKVDYRLGRNLTMMESKEKQFKETQKNTFRKYEPEKDSIEPTVDKVVGEDENGEPIFEKVVNPDLADFNKEIQEVLEEVVNIDIMTVPLSMMVDREGKDIELPAGTMRYAGFIFTDEAEKDKAV